MCAILCLIIIIIIIIIITINKLIMHLFNLNAGEIWFTQLALYLCFSGRLQEIVNDL